MLSVPPVPAVPSGGRLKVHYQPDVPDYTGDGNHEPLACNRDYPNLEKRGVTHNWEAATCLRCLRSRLSTRPARRTKSK